MPQFWEKLGQTLEQQAAEEIKVLHQIAAPTRSRKQKKKRRLNMEIASTSHGTRGPMIFWELFAGFEGLSRAVNQSGVAEVLPPLDYYTGQDVLHDDPFIRYQEIAPLRTYDGIERLLL